MTKRHAVGPRAGRIERRLRPPFGIFAAAVLVASCYRSYSLDCGPLDPISCDHRATEIVSTISREFVGHRVASIAILNAEGDAQVVLDDGTKVGFGQRHALPVVK